MEKLGGERLGGLYLGRARGAFGPLRVKSKRLKTHAVIVGMTGSGKTGLGLVLLEELVQKGIPVVAIDPKGDLGNLGLLFPDLQPQSFAPWTEEDPARVAKNWSDGLQKWDLAESDVAALRAKMRLRVYSPGSLRGIPVHVLGSLTRPEQRILEDGEARRQLVQDTVSGLLGLVGRTPDPVQDPGHVLLSSILEAAWRAGETPTLETLILRLVDPPMEKLGVFPVDRFFAPDDRMKLAMRLNGVVASPAFEPWKRGSPLDAEALFGDGRDHGSPKTPVSVFSLAHLQESERQFFVSLLLGRIQAWTRAQAGTEGLRGVLFLDEAHGYLPPHPKAPATKGPLLGLMKQARAMGLGVVLSTQNPVDLDYKALSNAGLWCIGRLSTEQDRDRLLKGMGGQGLHQAVADLAPREFLLKEVGRQDPEIFTSRHAMCFLKGPLTSIDVAALNALHGVAPAASAGESKVVAAALSLVDPSMGPPRTLLPGADVLPEVSPTSAEAKALKAGSASVLRGSTAGPETLWDTPPSVRGVDQWLLRREVVFSARMEGVFEAHRAPQSDGPTVCRPGLVAELGCRFDEDRVGFVLDERLWRVWFPLGSTRSEDYLSPRLEADDLRPIVSPGGFRYTPLPAWVDQEREFKALKKRLVDEIYRKRTQGMWVNKGLKLYGRPNETREEFSARVEEAVEARIEDAALKLHERAARSAHRLDERMAKKTARLAQVRGVAQGRQLEEAFNVGATILSLFGGRKKSFGTVLSKRRQSAQASSRVTELEAELERLQDDGEALEADLKKKLAALRAKEERHLAKTEERQVRLEKNDIQVLRFGVLWVPVSSRV